MAEVLAVVGIAANIGSLVDFGIRVLERLEQYQSTLAEIPEAFRHIKAELPVLLDALRQTKAAIDTGTVQDESGKALLPAVEGCSIQIKTLGEVIEKVLPTSSDSRATKGRKALRSLRYDSKVKKMTVVMRGYVQTLTYHAAASSKPLAGHTLPTSTPSSTVPFKRDEDFVKSDSLTQIFQICARPAARAALVGLGGVGKSQIAIEYAHRVRDESPDTWVFWVHAGTQARFEEGYRRIAEVTKIEGLNSPEANVLRLVRSWLCDESNGRWVIVVDNADDLSVFFPAVSGQEDAAAAEPPADFLPQSPNGSILITSRSQDVAYRLTGSYTSIIEVKPMDSDDAVTLLGKKLGSDMDEKHAVELVHLLDCMPLAITQAAAFVTQRKPHMTLSRYVEDVRSSDYDRSRLLGKDVGDSCRDGRASNSIITTWQISFEHIRANMPTAAQLLSLMSLFDCHGIPTSLLRGRYQLDDDREADFEDDIYKLTSYSLLKMSADGREFEMHRLVQFSTKIWLELNNELERWKMKYVMLLDESLPDGRYQNWPKCQVLFSHAQAAVGFRLSDKRALKAWASILFKAAWFARETGNYDVAAEMDSHALEARIAVLGEGHPDTLNSLENLGMVLSGQGKYKDAEVVYRRVLQLREKFLGPNHPDTIDSISNLALILSRQGRYNEAEIMHRKDVEESERVLGDTHADTLTAINNLGLALERLGKYEEAEAMHRKALAGREKILQHEHIETLDSVRNLALVLQKQGSLEVAKAMCERALDGHEKHCGHDHPATLMCIDSLGSVLQAQGKFEEAEVMHRSALEGYEKRQWQEHPYMLASFGFLGCALSRQGKYEEAELMLRKALTGREKVLGMEHPATLTSVHDMGFLFHQQHQHDVASPLYERAFSGYQHVLGLEHPTTIAYSRAYASLLDEMQTHDYASHPVT